MASSKLLLLAILVGLALAGCAGRPGAAAGDTQSFLGISQDIRSVWSTQSEYKSPLRTVLFGD